MKKIKLKEEIEKTKGDLPRKMLKGKIA